MDCLWGALNRNWVFHCKSHFNDHHYWDSLWHPNFKTCWIGTVALWKEYRKPWDVFRFIHFYEFDLDSNWRSLDKSLAHYYRNSSRHYNSRYTLCSTALQTGIPGIDSLRKDNHKRLVFGTGTARFTTINSKIVTHSEILILPGILHRFFTCFRPWIILNWSCSDYP